MKRYVVLESGCMDNNEKYPEDHIWDDWHNVFHGVFETKEQAIEATMIVCKNIIEDAYKPNLEIKETNDKHIVARITKPNLEIKEMNEKGIVTRVTFGFAGDYGIDYEYTIDIVEVQLNKVCNLTERDECEES